MHALGDKIASMIVAQTAQVPCLPWSGSGLTTGEEGGLVTDETYAQACVSTLEAAMDSAERIGYPLMLKASQGGGGKGIRRVEQSGDLPQAWHQVQAEQPGSPLFLMRLAEDARHLEVQLLADHHGQVISLYGRDCSVQRRHQKIIEEAPVTITKDFVALEEAAIRLAQLVGYRNAGTVEFLFDQQTGEYSFLELNPRLQVEHPCTEAISGVNLPVAQLLIAMGIPLHQ